MNAPKQLKVTPKVWHAVKEDSQTPRYQSMSKTQRQERLGKKHKVSYTTVYNVENSDSYLEYLESHAPSALEWYRENEDMCEDCESPVVAELKMSDVVELALLDFENHLRFKRLNQRVAFYKFVAFASAISLVVVTAYFTLVS